MFRMVPLSSNAITNYSKQETRRAEWVFGVEYGEDFEKVKAVLQRIIDADPRILKDPAPMIALGALSASSVDIKVRAWAKTADYWDVYFDMNKIVYDTFNKEGIGFPFPQLTVHQQKTDCDFYIKNGKSISSSFVWMGNAFLFE